MKRRWKIILIFVVLLALVWLWIENLGRAPEKEVDAYKESLMARGEKLEISQVLPPPVSKEQNGADVFYKAISLFTPEDEDSTNIVSGMRMVSPGKAMVCFTQPEVREFDFTNSWSNVMAVVEDNRPAIELLKQAACFQALDFHVDYTRWPGILTGYVFDLARASQRLTTDAICHLRRGDTAPAATNICAIIGLVNAERDDRDVYCQLERYAMASRAANANWELLQSTNVNDEELAMLQKRWEQLEYVRSMENALIMERACMEASIRKMRASDEYFNSMVNGDGPSYAGDGFGNWTDNIHDLWDHVKFGYSRSMWRAKWTFSNELSMLQDDQIVLETVREIETNGSFNNAYIDMDARRRSAGVITDTPEDRMILARPDIRWFFSGDSSFSDSVIRRTMTAQVTKNCVVTAIALKRYQLKHGNYPPDLNALVPEFLPAVPLDPVDGKPLRYRPNADGTFLLYSVGPNGKDDGGNPALEKGVESSSLYWLNPHVLDWVWPQPATAKEIQNHFAHPAR